MGKDDVKKIAGISPKSSIIAVHMEAINHCVLTRKELRAFVKAQKLEKRVFIPKDGQKYSFKILKNNNRRGKLQFALFVVSHDRQLFLMAKNCLCDTHLD